MVSKIKAGCRFYLLPLEDHGHELLVIPAKTYKKKGIRFHFFSHISGESSLFHKNDTGNSTLSALEVPSGDGDSDCKLVWTDSWETLCHFLRNEYGENKDETLLSSPPPSVGRLWWIMYSASTMPTFLVRSPYWKREHQIIINLCHDATAR